MEAHVVTGFSLGLCPSSDLLSCLQSTFRPLPPHFPAHPFPTLFPPAFLPTCGLLLVGCLLCFLLSSVWSLVTPAPCLVADLSGSQSHHQSCYMLAGLATFASCSFLSPPTSGCCLSTNASSARSLPTCESYSSYSYPVFLRGAS